MSRPARTSFSHRLTTGSHQQLAGGSGRAAGGLFQGLLPGRGVRVPGLGILPVLLVERGGSVLISSHVMALVEELCDTVGVMARGRVVAEGPLDEVRGGRSLEDTFVGLVGVKIGGGEGLSWLAS
ncbi:hypothetical protein WBG99_25925 [Streptomyces sp. TG1A-60]|uniref:hypothetical protein n=1 Tax=Streptomyces sp. TG1A-60 TaxID=3129111 RepID=UPI0030D4766A